MLCIISQKKIFRENQNSQWKQFYEIVFYYENVLNLEDKLAKNQRKSFFNLPE